MNDDLKSLVINIFAGLITYIFVEFFNKKGPHLYSFFVLLLYAAFIAASYFRFKASFHPLVGPVEENGECGSDDDEYNDKQEIFHKILQNVVFLAAQHADSSPKNIGKLIDVSPSLVLAYLKEMEAENLVVFSNNGNPAELSTKFFVAFHENVSKYITVKSR